MTVDSPKPEVATMPEAAKGGRLAGKTVVITGAAGNLGSEISRHVAREGAFVIMTGRTKTRIDAAMDALVQETGIPETRVMTTVLDGGNPESVRQGLAKVKSVFGRVDVLINNAGSAGPKQTLDNVPLTRAEADALGEAETVGDALRNIFGVTWNLVRAAAPLMPRGGSIVNVSTIFSHTPYFARAPYVVPKAALNALSMQFAKELGARGIRVNTVFPGPIESERIRTVFAAMDKLQGLEDGETADFFLGKMHLKRSMGGQPRRTLPTPKDIANTCLFLASDESAALSGAEFDVTHAMSVNKRSFSTFNMRPTMRDLDGTGLSVLVLAGERWDDALEIARMQVAAGARVLLGLTRQADVAQAEARVRAGSDSDALSIARFNRSEPEKMERLLSEYSAEKGPIASAIVLPVKASNYFTGALVDAHDSDVEEFMSVELEGALAVARTLSRYWKTGPALLQAPRVVFISNPSDGAGDHFNRLLAAGVGQLLQIWRDEARVTAGDNVLLGQVWGNQIIRYTNEESENAWFAAGHATRIVLNEQKIGEINLQLPVDIAVETGARKSKVGSAENITGLHLGKVAFITGGSAGIGGQMARLLALAGAKVMMVARRESELEAACDKIVNELKDVGFSGVERRVKFMAGVDVSDFASLSEAVEETIRAFGRIDYLINNAGVAGAEDMVVDMDLDAWRQTLNANLISNYHLMAKTVPVMKANGSGYVLNVSSYFGGEKSLAVAYPNRADYAVSKAGQRAMVESFSHFLGPEVQFNAIAPGPVDGDRLSGTGGRPGLFQRRARLILENKRLNAVHGAVIAAVREGADIETILGRLAHNSTSNLSHDARAPRPLREVALECARQGNGICTWDQYLLTSDIAERLLSRLRLGGYLLGSNMYPAPSPADPERPSWLHFLPPDDKPFLPQEAIESEAEKVSTGVLSQLHLGRMPTESEVAQATVFFLADRAVTGETFMPSGGLSVERSTTEREMFGSPKPERLAQMQGRTVWIIGEHLKDYIVSAVRYLVSDCGVAHAVIITRSDKSGEEIRQALADCPADALHFLTAGDDIETAMDSAMQAYGRPTTVVSMPYEGLPLDGFDNLDGLPPEVFARVVEANLTQHFRVSRKASLYDDCQLVLVSPDVPFGTGGGAFSLANFLKTTLHAFTATLGVENERLVHDVPVNQINLTRRVRSEEPRNEAEYQEELKRFVRAVLLVGAPLPDAQDSRYRARIYRGTSMTV